MANVYHKYCGYGLKGHQQSQLASRKSSQVRVPSERHHFQDLPVTPRPARCPSGPPCAHPDTSVASRHPSPPRTLARNRAHLLGHAEAHSLTLPLPRRGPSSRSALGRGSRGSATEADRVGVAQRRLRGSARPPGASRRLPCSPRSMSEPPRSRRSARRAPPRCSALRPRPPAQSPPRASAPPSREPVPGVTDHLTATCALRHVGSGGGAGQGRGRSAKTRGGDGRKGDSESVQAAASGWGLLFNPKFATRKVPSQDSGLATAPFSAPSAPA